MSHKHRARSGAVSVVFVLVVAMGGVWAGACDDTEKTSSPAASAAPTTTQSSDPTPEGGVGTFVKTNFDKSAAFFDLPFPNDARRDQNGMVDMSGFPNPNDNPYVKKLLAVIGSTTSGFGTTSTIHFTFNHAIDPDTLPELAATINNDSSVMLINIDANSDSLGEQIPVYVEYSEDAGYYGGKHFVTLMPLQGIALRPNTKYAAVITTAVKDADGKATGPSVELATWMKGKSVTGVSDSVNQSHIDALGELKKLGVDPLKLSGLTVFTTWDPTAEFKEYLDDAISRPRPQAGDFTLGEVFDRYCVFSTTIKMPDYQSGEPPFAAEGGGWVRDSKGKPKWQRDEEANFVVTVPGQSMPQSGFPMMFFSRTGGGGERPLVDRGRHAEAHGPVVVEGSGPANDFASVGFAGMSIDGPHGGLRNITHADEQFLMFNVNNPTAMRDNVRQSALEIALSAHILDDVNIPESVAQMCPDLVTKGDGVIFDTGKLAVMGHSMGATIAPLSFAMESRFGAMVLSGAGGSWTANVVFKQSPIATKPVANALLGYQGSGYEVTQWDPAVNLLQWAGETADPPVYALQVTRQREETGPRHILMLQGIVDTYILPPMANTSSLSMGLDLGGQELDRDDDRIAQFSPIGDLLSYSGRKSVSLPASGNAKSKGGNSTVLVIQHKEDGIEDGHEVVFQTEAPKHEYRCFLKSFLSGTPKVPQGKGEFDDCP